MNKRIKGIIVSVLGSMLFFLTVIGIGAIISATATDPWAGLVFSIFAVLFGVFVLLVVLIATAVKYRKNKSEYALGIVYGITGYLLFGVVLLLIGVIFN